MEKKEPCYQVLRSGSCRFGGDCKYSHDVQAVAQVQALVCKQFARGKCARGDKCPLRHVSDGEVGAARVGVAAAA